MNRFKMLLKNFISKFTYLINLFENFINRHSVIFIIILFISAFAIVLSRKLDVLYYPQFWAEDGRYWYADAYNLGPINSILVPYSGSLQFAMRIIGSISLLIPLKFVPGFFAFIAITIQILPILLINTKRYYSLIPNFKARIFISILYLSIPNSFEIHANLTNINWHLALLAFIVILSPAPKSRAWKFFDYSSLIIAGLTGPFAIVLGITALFKFKKTNTYRSENLKRLIIISVCALVQILSPYLLNGIDRFNHPNGATIDLFLRIIGVRIGASSVVGMNTINSQIYGELLSPIYILFAIFVIVIIVLSFVKGPLNLKLLIVFTWGIFFAALIKPQASINVFQWQGMVMGAGNRYFFLPMLSWIISLVWLFGYTRNRYLKIIPLTPLIIMCFIGIPKDWTYQPWPNLNFNSEVEKFINTPPGETVCMNINPDWNMCLNKK